MDRNIIAEKLLAYLSSKSSPVKLSQIAKSLGFKSSSEDYFAMKSVLDEYVSSHLIESQPRNKYVLADFDKVNTLHGKIRMYNDRGIVKTDNPEFQEVLVRRGDLLTALDGDEVLVQLFALKKNRQIRGEVVKVIKRSNKPIIGKIEMDGGIAFLNPEETHFYVDFLVPQHKLRGAKEGDKVKAFLYMWEDPYKLPQAEVSEIIGKSGKVEVEYESIIKEFELPEEFPSNVIEEALSFDEPDAKVPDYRMDLTKEDIITIDPFDAKDFDDALSLKILENGNYYLGVHIADVSHYVQENSALDIEARLRGNSVYLVDRVIPMLPEELSNNICSLKPDVPRFAYSVFIEISPRGAVKDYLVKESVMVSKRRFTYEEVLEIIESGEGDFSSLIADLHKLTRMLRQKRFRSGGIEFETQEVKFILDENKFPVEVKIKQPNDSTELVEECMLLANQVVAGHLKKLSKDHNVKKLPFLYRVHEDPDPARLSEAMTFINSLGYKMPLKDLSSFDINNLFKQLKDKPEKNTIHSVLIRSMPKAIYSHNNIGHYGLGFKEYSHFTSPIRRYPDLIVHRLLKEYSKDKVDPSRRQYLNALVKEAGSHCSQTERLAMEAERASTKLTQSIIAKENIGSEFNGTVTGVMNFGIFILLDELHTEGLLHIRNLDDDYYHYDEKRMRLVGRKHKRILGFGSRLRVKIIKVNMQKRQIDLAYIDDHPYE